MRLSVAVVVAAIGGAAVLVMVPGRKPPPAAPPPPAQADVTLNIQPDSASVLVDGAPSGRHFTHKPGPAQVVVQADGYLPVTLGSLAPGAQTVPIELKKAGPRTYTVKISTDPSEAEISEGALLIGKSPILWTAAEGEHELTLQRSGYHEEKVRLTVTRDDEKAFKLRKIETAHKIAAPDLGIKAER